MVTYEGLFAFSLVIIALVSLWGMPHNATAGATTDNFPSYCPKILANTQSIRSVF